MAIIVSDSFNRANDPTGLGTADTGQAWTTVAGNWSVLSSEANITWDNGDPGTSIAVLETGFTDAVASVEIVTADLPNFAAGMGLVFRYVDTNYYWRLATWDFPGAAGRLRLQRIYAGSVTTVIDTANGTVTDNDVISVSYCGSDLEIFVNDVSQGTYDDSSNPQNYGTQCGLVSVAGTTFFLYSKQMDDFLVETNGTCTATYNCTGGACVDPGDGTGTYASLAACLDGCAVSESYDCVDSECTDPGDGTGAYATLAECVDSGCGGGTVVVETKRFDAGTGSGYYYVAPIIDSGDELRSKTVKAVRCIGKFTNAASEIYGYDISDVINVADLEDGTNSTTGQLAIDDTGGVAQTPRTQVNVPNAVLHTVRIIGDDTGETTRDSIHEIVTEQSIIGVRR